MSLPQRAACRIYCLAAMQRRQFLSTSAAAMIAAESKKRVGVIGPGWYGKADLFRLIQVAPVEVVSIADPDSRMLESAAEMIATRQLSKKKPRTYKNYRDMLKEKDLDLVLIATPDHWHALAAIDAIKAGCDLYLQKPISTDIIEGQSILAAARKYNRVVQVGTQRRSTPHLIEAKDEIVRAGKLGKIGLVEVYCYTGRRTQPVADKPAPDYLDWDLWTGPAPMRPYNELAHPGGWRNFVEYGNGIMGDMCIHMLDMVRWMMDLGWPTRVSSTGGILVHKNAKPNTPDTQVANWDFGDVRVVWQHRCYGRGPDPDYWWGANFYGDKGTLKASVFRYDYTPIDKGAQPVHKDVTYELEQYPEDKTEPRLEKHVAPAIRRHMQDLLAASEKRSKPVADIEQGHISTASCIMANMALELGRTLNWDADKHQFIGDAEANRKLRRPYRKPYVHPEPNAV